MSFGSLRRAQAPFPIPALDSSTGRFVPLHYPETDSSPGCTGAPCRSFHGRFPLARGRTSSKRRRPLGGRLPIRIREGLTDSCSQRPFGPPIRARRPARRATNSSCLVAKGRVVDFDLSRGHLDRSCPHCGSATLPNPERSSAIRELRLHRHRRSQPPHFLEVLEIRVRSPAADGPLFWTPAMVGMERAVRHGSTESDTFWTF
jgi:hypothetical protein